MWKEYKIDTNFKITSFYSAFTRVCPVEYFFQGESHDFWEIVFVVKGSVCVCADDRIIQLNKNQLIFHKPMEFHSLRTPKNTHTELFTVSFSCKGDFINCFKNRIYSLKGKEKEYILEIFNIVMSHNECNGNFHIPTDCLENLCKKPMEFLIFKNLFENFLVRLSKSSQCDGGYIKNTETEIYGEALRIIDKNIYSKLTVESLAKACNASASYLKKIFRKYNGLGIHEYILNTKFSAAKELLRKGESVTETARKLGFSSQNYFSTAFKRVVGVSPCKYKSD